MKPILKIIYCVFFLLLTTNLFSQETNGKKNYKDLGTWKLEINGNELRISAFATIEKIIDVKKKEITEDTKYKYEVYLISKSKYENEITSTWIYGGKIFVNEEEVTYKQFPYGFTVLIKTQPTLVWHDIIDKDDIEIKIDWEEAKFENRIRK